MTEVPRVLLLMDGPVEARNAGELFVRTLCCHVPTGRLCRFSLSRSTKQGGQTGEWLGFPHAVAQRIWERRFTRLGGPLSRAACLPINQYARSVHARRLAAQVTTFGRTHGVELVWAILNSPQVIYMARRVARELCVPLVLTVWDPPERLAHDLNMDALSRNRMMRDFSATLHSAARVGVASEGMKAEYSTRYGVESIVQIQGVFPEWERAGPAALGEDDRLTLGFAGSMYASREWQALIAALSSVEWRIGERDVAIRVLGTSMDVAAPYGVRIEYLGWRPIRETVKLMSEVDVAYVPYWFQREYRLASRLCFPNKVSAYLAAGLPLFVHAPVDSSPAAFAEKFGVGVLCDSLDASAIVGTLELLVREPALYRRLAEASRNAIDQELAIDVFLQRFACLVGAGPDALRAPNEECVGGGE